MRKPSTAKGKILLFLGGFMPILVGNTKKQLEPPVENPPDIIAAKVNCSNDVVSPDIVGCLVAGPYCPLPLIFT